MRGKKNFRAIVVLIVICLFVANCTIDKLPNSANRDRLLNNEWKFIRDSLPYQEGLVTAEKPEFDDSKWMVVDLPHDYSIMDLPGEDGPGQIGPFSAEAPGGRATGNTLGGTGWYRKEFTMDKKDEGKTAVLKFGGVYMETEVWVNGKQVGVNKYGYSPFWFDITTLLNPAGESNVIAVKVDNIGRNTRWYSGSGIYRNVHLILTHPVHVAVWGVYVTTPEITGDCAVVDLAITTQNDSKNTADAMIKVKVLDKNGHFVGETESPLQIAPNAANISNLQMSIEDPDLWSIETPDLYYAEITIESEDKVVDSYTQFFGVRTVEFSVENGFLLNGESILLKGACMHHDNGLLGAAAFDRAEERRVEIMKANGFNAIRTAHNPPSEAFLNACDRLGMLVVDEFVDMWEAAKNPQDYSRFFAEWWEKDFESMILRDRNHPSIILWSIGNEVREKINENGLRIGRELVYFCHEMDSTRMVTNAIDLFMYEWDENADAMALLDVAGINYQWTRYEEDHEKYPNRIMLGTESIAKEAFENWEQVKKHPYVVGDFVWAGMDYLGEARVGNTRYVSTDQEEDGMSFFRRSSWPWFGAWCGDIDITGEKKPQMIYRDVIWDNSKLEINVHAPVPEGMVEQVGRWGWPDELPHWTWPGSEGKPLQVRVFTKGDRARLELNGEVIGEKEVSTDTKYIATFDVPYESGELKAIAYEDGKEIATKMLKTAGEPTSIRLIADRDEINADRNDLSFVKIEIVDEKGQVVPRDSVLIKLTLTGNGELAASGNASPDDMESFNKPVVKTFRGKAQAIVRPFAKMGTITLKAESDGLTTGELKLRVQAGAH